MRDNISSILEGLHSSRLDEDKWVTIDGNKVLLGNNGESKTDPSKKSSDSKSKKKEPAWKSQLSDMAKSKKMPAVVMGSKEQQSEIFKEINKLYPDLKDDSARRITDQGDAIYIDYGGSVKRSYYPSGKNASQEEKDGVKKWLMYGKKQKESK